MEREWPGWPDDDWWTPEWVPVADGSRLACRVRDGAARPVIVVHGLASNALLWRDVAESLVRSAHAVAAVDLRSHGRSDESVYGHDTKTAAADLISLVRRLGWLERRPVVVGQSWGANVALRAAADPSEALAGAVCVDGGWIHLADRYPSFDDCWVQLAPPGFGSATPDAVIERLEAIFEGWPPNAVPAVAGNLRVDGDRVHNRLPGPQHRSILHSLWSDDPAEVYARVTAPVHLMVAGRSSSAEVDAAVSQLPAATVSWHPQAAHDLHLQHPQTVVHHLNELLGRVERSRA